MMTKQDDRRPTTDDDEDQDEDDCADGRDGRDGLDGRVRPPKTVDRQTAAGESVVSCELWLSARVEASPSDPEC